jgi:predicted phage terminase large subunit-like protein
MRSRDELQDLSREIKLLQVEHEKRQRARKDLLTYASIINIPSGPIREEAAEEVEAFRPRKKLFGAHHILWLDCLQQVEDGKIKRLMGLFPPGAGKSIYSSVVFPTHYMGRFKNSNLIITSYGTDLPRKFGRRARSIVQQNIYKRIFGCDLSSESSAAHEWALTNNSEWMAAGILTGITGNRADGVIWDDLIKGREQADSPVVRQKTWEAYIDDLLTRKKPNAFEIGITTRWHEDDVAGRILPENYSGESGLIQCRDGNEWYVVCLPAECEREDDPLGRKIGQILWPEWFNKEMFAPFKRNPRTWSSLYQQRPAPEAGVLFKGEWFKTYEVDLKTGMPMGMKPGDLNVYGASDYAVTTDGGDYTVHIVVGLDNNQDIYVLDLWRSRTTADKWIETFCDLVRKWKPLGWAEETGQIKSSIGPFLTKRMRERKAYVSRAQFPATKSKSMRAQSIIGRMAQNGLFCPFGADWFAEFRKELLMFDAGTHDDQVDALGLIGQVLDRMIPADMAPSQKEEAKVLSTDPTKCTVTLEDLFEANEQRFKGSGILRIH